MKYKVVYGGFECPPHTTLIGVTVDEEYTKYKTVFGIFRKRLTRKTVISILNEYPLVTYPITALMGSLRALGRADKEYEV